MDAANALRSGPGRTVHSAAMEDVRIVDVVDAATFGLVPPCADPAFDHRSCDYWEDADRGSKARRSLARAAARPSRPAPALADNPFAPAASRSAFNPFLEERESLSVAQNPFAPSLPSRPGAVAPDAPSKLALL